MSVRAVNHGSQAYDRLRKATDTVPLALLLASIALQSSPAAAAQVSGAVSIFSDDRYRGASLSDGRPVAILDLDYDAPNGLYGALSGKIVATRHDGLRPLGLVLNAGYAWRQSSGISIDAGVVHSIYSEYSSRIASRSFTEAYVGATGKFVSGRVYISPDYIRRGVSSLSGEVEGHVPLADKLRLTGDVGLLVPLGGQSYRSQFDVRLGVVREFGPVSVQVAWTAVSPGNNIYSSAHYNRSALIVGITTAF